MRLAPAADDVTLAGRLKYTCAFRLETFTDAARKGRHLRYLGSWDTDDAQRVAQIHEGGTLVSAAACRSCSAAAELFEAGTLRAKVVPQRFHILAHDAALFRRVNESESYGRAAVEQVILPFVPAFVATADCAVPR